MFRGRRHCPHSRLRGIYGDEILHRMNVWSGRIFRLECLDCRSLLDGPVSLAKTRHAEWAEDSDA